jgi:hypothetical protein
MRFGVEFEFTAAVAHAAHPHYGTFYDYLLGLFADCGLGKWRLDLDASCGNEIVSPILDGEQGLAQLIQVCYCIEKARNLFGLSRLTGLDCGLHFHFDAKSLPTRALKNVLVTMAVAEPLFYAMNPLSRFSTAFAAPLSFNLFQMFRARDIVDMRDIWFRSNNGVSAQADSFRNKVNDYQPHFINSDRQPQKYDWTRYHGLNFVALFKHGTMEFRYPQGTFDPETVKLWFELFMSVVEMSVNNKTRTIIKHYPYDMSYVKQHPISKLQQTCYMDIGIVLKFLFSERQTKFGPTRLLKPTVPALKFIAHRLMKFTSSCMKADRYEQIMNYPDGENPDKLLERMVEVPIGVSHYKHVIVPNTDFREEPQEGRPMEIRDQPRVENR